MLRSRPTLGTDHIEADEAKVVAGYGGRQLVVGRLDGGRLSEFRSNFLDFSD